MASRKENSSRRRWQGDLDECAGTNKKAAAWALANGLRNELRDQGTLVMAVHAGYIDTDMTVAIDAPKSRPEDIAARVIEGLLAGSEEALADDASKRAKLGFNATPAFYLTAGR